MFNPLRKTFESDNEGPNKIIDFKESKDKGMNFVNKNKGSKFKVPKNFGKKKFKYTIEEESDTNMILEHELENNNKSEKSITNNINLKLFSHEPILWKKAAIFLLVIKVGKNMKNEEIKSKTLEYLFKITNSTKEFWKVFQISEEKDIKQAIIDYIKMNKFKIKLLLIYLEKKDLEMKKIVDNNMNDSGFNNDTFIDLFSCNEINIPFYIITEKYVYAKLFNKKMNYIFMNNDFLCEKEVKVLLFRDKKISPNNSSNDILGKDDININNNCLINNINKVNEPITITTRGFLPEFKDTKITIEGSTSSTLSLSSDEDYLDNSVIYTKNGIGILQFNINND